MKRFLYSFFIIICICNTLSAKIIGKSEEIRPRWLKTTPVPLNCSYQIEMTDVSLAETLDGARMASVKELSKRVAGSSIISSQEKFDVSSNQIGRNGNVSDENYGEIYQLNVGEDREKTQLVYKVIDEYWETEVNAGVQTIRLWTLYAVTKNPHAYFDSFESTRNYGATPAVMSIIPGLGQIYKGSTIKGICMFAGVAVCGIGALVCESQRSDYKNKMKEQPQFAKDYNTKANNWETGRNVCLGAAAAVWIYNIIDAAAAKGARKIIVKPASGSSMSVHPIATLNEFGILLAYNF